MISVGNLIRLCIRQSTKCPTPCSYSTQCMTTSEDEYQRLLITEPKSPPLSKVIKVAVIGMPNAGKSTLLNAFLSRDILPTSSKIDTTTKNTSAVLTIDETQIIFYDTPGLHNRSKAKRLASNGSPRIQHPSKCFGESDIGLVLADLTNRRTKEGFLPPEILLTLTQNRHVPTVLVLTKDDAYKKRSNLFQLIYLFTAGKLNNQPFAPKQQETTPMRTPKITPIDFDEFNYDILEDDMPSLMKLRRCRGWPYFKEVFTVSANSHKNVDLILNYLLSKAKYGKWKYNENVQIDCSPKECVVDLFRAEMLNFLPHEIPYSIQILLANWNLEEGILHVNLDIVAKTLRHQKIFTAHKQNIVKRTRQRLQDLFFCEVFLRAMLV